MMESVDFASLYRRFDAPIAHFDCGAHCAPHNERGVPFCCDTRHAVPAVYDEEWKYLQVNTDLWRPWQGRSPAERRRLQEETPDGMTLLECKGSQFCQRQFRSLTCRAFPFFPYITRDDWFIGLTYYWEYEYACWVISNLHVVTAEYLAQFFAAFDELFERMPQEREGYRQYSMTMRRVFGRRRRAIPLLHRNGKVYKITPRNGRMRRVDARSLPAFGPYKIARELPFSDESQL
jgi:hypothetical protein